VVFQSFVFGQILAVLGNIGQIWAEFVALSVAENMPKARLKILKPSKLSTMNPNTTWSSSLKSYHPYLTLQKFSKYPQTYCVYNALLKSARSHFGCLCLLVVK
jgi:hypothetical protein